MTEIKRRLNEFIKADKCLYLSKSGGAVRRARIRHDKKYMIWKYMYFLRLSEYHTQMARENKEQGKRFSKFYYEKKSLFIDRKLNKFGEKTGIEVSKFHLEKSVRICHSGVVINGYVGENCVFHGNNIVGVKKTGDKDSVPKLGKRVDIGAGAIIIGNVEIADDCIIGAGAVVTKSFKTPGTVIAGVPAKEILNK